MRRACLSDLHHAARAVQTVPQAARGEFCARLLWQAHVADKYVKRLRKLHPKWGDGSLRAAAMVDLAGAEGHCCSADYYRAMAVVIAQMDRANGDHARVTSLQQVDM